MTIGDIAAAVGKGLAAGAVGTAAMTVSSTIEAKVRQREGSSAPADAAAKVLGIEPKDDKAKARFATGVHWAYGTSWGAARGLVASAGLAGAPAGAAHFAVVWGTGLVMLPGLEVAPPVKEWGATELAVDAWHHLVYAAATTLAYGFLTRRSATAT